MIKVSTLALVFVGSFSGANAGSPDCGAIAEHAASEAVKGLYLKNLDWLGRPVYMSEAEDLRRENSRVFDIEIEYLAKFRLEVLIGAPPACLIWNVREI